MQRRIVRVYDVDGTLSDSLDHNYRTTFKTHCHFRLMPPTIDEYRDKYDQSDGFRKLQRSIGVLDTLIPTYNQYWWKTYCKMVVEYPPGMIPGAKEEVNRLASLGAHLVLLTKATEKNTDLKLGMAWVRSVFKEMIFVDDTIDKTVAMAALKGRMNGDGVIYFGDTLSDGQACLAAGIKFGAMIHGYSYNSERMLMEFVKSSKGNAVAVKGVADFQRSAEDAFR